MIQIPELVKRCKACKEHKPLLEFHKNSSSRDGLMSRCKVCNRKVAAQWHRDNRARSRANSTTFRLRSRYGLTVAQKQQMVVAQGGCCACCTKRFKSTRDTHLDHCHATGQVRSILCSRCNRGLGFFEDDPALTDAASAYIRHHRARLMPVPWVPR